MFLCSFTYSLFHLNSSNSALASCKSFVSKPAVSCSGQQLSLSFFHHRTFIAALPCATPQYAALRLRVFDRHSLLVNLQRELGIDSQHFCCLRPRLGSLT